MSHITFTRRMDAHSLCVVSSEADLSGGCYLTVKAARSTGLVELGLFYSAALAAYQSLMTFTLVQARAVAAELMACADAHSSGASSAEWRT